MYGNQSEQLNRKKNTSMNSINDEIQRKNPNHFWDTENYKNDLDKRIKAHYVNPRQLELSQIGQPFFERIEIDQKSCDQYYKLMENGIRIETFIEKDKKGNHLTKCKIKIIVRNIHFDPGSEDTSYVILKEIRHCTVDRPEFSSIMYNPLFFEDQYSQECVRIGLELVVDDEFMIDGTPDDSLESPSLIELHQTIGHLLYDIGIRYNALEDIWIKDDINESVQ